MSLILKSPLLSANPQSTRCWIQLLALQTFPNSNPHVFKPLLPIRDPIQFSITSQRLVLTHSCSLLVCSKHKRTRGMEWVTQKEVFPEPRSWQQQRHLRWMHQRRTDRYDSQELVTLFLFLCSSWQPFCIAPSSAPASNLGANVILHEGQVYKKKQTIGTHQEKMTTIYNSNSPLLL